MYLQQTRLWFRILESQMETGTPYMLYKDHANRKSNQQNLGTIHCSNLFTEIIEYTLPDKVAVCNLAYIALPALEAAWRSSRGGPRVEAAWRLLGGCVSAGDGHAHGQCTSNAGRRGSTVTALPTLTTLLCYGGGLHSASQEHLQGPAARQVASSSTTDRTYDVAALMPLPPRASSGTTTRP